MLVGMSFMVDTRRRYVADTPRGVHPRLSQAAIERAKQTFAVDGLAGVAERLGFANTATLWRARRGLTPIRLSEALRIANLLDMPIDRVFERDVDA